MLTVISGTNRAGSNTEKSARHIFELLSKKTEQVGYFSLQQLPGDFIHGAMYDGIKSDAFKKIESEVLQPTTKFLFIIPEYNGGYPGIMKLMIDGSHIPSCYHNKKAGLIGVSTGRAGNLRGIDTFGLTLQHMRMNLFYNKLPISVVDSELNEENQFFKEKTLLAVHKMLDEFVKF